MTQELASESDRQGSMYQIGMEHLIRLDIPKALPLFKDYLIIMNELVEHPDPRYIDCEEAFKQCLWLENRGYKPKPLSALGGMFNANAMLLPNPQVFAGYSASNPR